MAILVTGATGMFGSAVVNSLAELDVEVLAMTRSEESAKELTKENITGVVGDLDNPESLKSVMKDAERMFLVSPMHASLGKREVAAINAASHAEVKQIVKLYGSVRHEGDQLDTQHQLSLDALQICNIPWTLVSPQTVMETNLLGQKEAINTERCMYGAAGDGRIGMVALSDCIDVASVVLQSDPHDWKSKNLEITGPAALTYKEIAAEMSRAFNQTISYKDMNEADFSSMLIEFGFPPEDLELQLLCHFRQMRNGKASLVTETYHKVTGRKPTSIYDWTCQHQALFNL